MQDVNEIQTIKLERLNLRLAEIEAERDCIQKEVRTLRSSLTKTSSTDLWSRAMIAALGILTVASLLATGAFHYAQSNVKEDDQPEVSVTSTAETGQIARGKHQYASGKKQPAVSGKEKSIYSSANVPGQRQWGPSLVMPEPGAGKSHFVYDPLVKQQQENLLTLGFDLGEADGFKGARTRDAIAEFRALYLPDTAKAPKDADLAIIMENYAKLARDDAARFGIDQGVVAAIRLSSVRTGVSFSYLMKLAATESNFKPASESATSSATGMYQFTRDTWLNTLKMHGAKYGLVADYAAKIEYYVTRGGYQRPMVREESLYQHLLELRKNPRISAIMTAETVLDNKQELTHLLQREPTETDLYLAHFLGSDKAITFLRSLEQSPGTYAVNLFPEAASSNYDIFHPKTCEPRTIDEVYALFGDKFSTRRYDDFAAN
jgi:hypothetical protein